MAGKTDVERIERLEADYAFVREAFTEIRDHLARQNGHLAELKTFKVQVVTVLAVIVFALASSGAVVGFMEAVYR